MKLIATVIAVLFLPVCWRKPRYGMILLVTLQVIFLGASLELDPEKFVYGVFFGLLMLAWIPGGFRTRHVWLKHPIAKWLVALFALFLASRLVGAVHGIPTIDWFREMSPMLNYSWIFLGIYAFSPEVDLRKYSLLLLAGLAILTVPITLQLLVFRSFLDTGTDYLANRTLTPAVTVFGSLLATAFVLEAKDSQTKGKFLIVVAGFVLAALLMGTRTNVAGMVIAFLVYFWLLRREGKASIRKAFAAVVAPLVLVSIVLFALSVTRVINMEVFSGRYAETLTAEMLDDPTFTDRVAETINAWVAFSGSPIVGQGLGYRNESVYNYGGVQIQPELFFFHNFYIGLLAKFGVTGFIVFTGFLISIIRLAAKAYFRMPDSFEKFYCGSIVALIITLMFESVLGSQFVDRLPAALLGIMVGMMIAMDFRSRAATRISYALAGSS